ncbi:hypothetical protein [Ferrimonas senticii]|uniref:hypothetical protein n=1 Tax=Ferrimonas senticii TaxID=394566 RepID=UPI0003F737CA|nr:hypothetical protein [Ferrimonas senticii]
MNGLPIAVVALIAAYAGLLCALRYVSPPAMLVVMATSIFVICYQLHRQAQANHNHLRAKFFAAMTGLHAIEVLLVVVVACVKNSHHVGYGVILAVLVLYASKQLLQLLLPWFEKQLQ